MDLLNDPKFPDRPQHPDFWKLAEVILEMDGIFDESGGDEYFEKFLKTEIDPDSIIYMAMQRGMRLKDVVPTSLAALYIEAFLVGRIYERRYGQRQ